MRVLKKDGSLDIFRKDSIKTAVSKSAERVNRKVSEEDLETIAQKVKDRSYDTIPVSEIHTLVELELTAFDEMISNSYKSYRNYKLDFVRMIDNVMKTKMELDYRGDRENANVDSAFVSTKRSLIYKTLNKELYKSNFLSTVEKRAIKQGEIYIHDIGDRLDTFNCCLFDMETVLKGGFELANMRYNEPNSLDVAFDVVADVTLAAAAQQYGGFTIPEVDEVLLPYAIKSYENYIKEYAEITGDNGDKAKEYALKKIKRDSEQGFQSWEYKFNTLASSRGDYPFVTTSLGLSTHPLGQILNSAALKVRMEGQGEKGKKRPVLFPKIVFLYDENLHGAGKELEHVFEDAVNCSSKALYPDYLSLTGDGYVADMYKQYGEVVSPMGK